MAVLLFGRTGNKMAAVGGTAYSTVSLLYSCSMAWRGMAWHGTAQYGRAAEGVLSPARGHKDVCGEGVSGTRCA